MIKIEVLIKDKNWKKYLSNPNRYLNSQAKKINLKKYLRSKLINISILLTGNNDLRFLNKKFRKKNKTTDVLSFPSYDQNTIRTELKSQKNLYLGDIALNLYKIDRGKNKFKSEFDKLWVHGLVHLMGYKHYKNKDFFKMKKIEDKIIKQLKC
jgi:probable rRNA maturation factor